MIRAFIFIILIIVNLLVKLNLKSVNLLDKIKINKIVFRYHNICLENHRIIRD